MDFLQRKAISAGFVIACGAVLVLIGVFLPTDFALIYLPIGIFLIIIGIHELREYRNLSRIIEIGRKAIKKKRRSS